MPDPASTLAFSCLLLFFALLYCYLLTKAETGAVNAKEAELLELSAKHPNTVSKILSLRKDTNSFVAKVRTCRITAFLFMGGLSALGILTPLFQILECSFWGKAAFSLLLLFLLSSLIVLFSFILPKNAAMKHCLRTALSLCWLLSFSCVLAAPFAAASAGASSALMKLFGIPAAPRGQIVTEEEILMLVDEGEESGVLEQNTKDLIENIFDFHDTVTSEIMTHRTEVTAVEDTDPIEKAAALSMEKGYSRLPVYHEDIDNICGIVYVKDLLPYIGRPIDREIRISSLMRKAYFVPESKQCGELFHEMTEKHIQIAVIIDEYGGTEGIVTMEDLLEEIVGNIQDEYDNENEEIRKVSENIFTVDGTLPIDEISDLTGVELPEGEYDTVAGFVVDLLGRLPEANEHPCVEWKNLSFAVEELDERRIARIRITVKEGSSSAEAADF